MRNKPSKFIDRIFFGRLVNSINERKPFSLHKMGDRLIGRDHEFFNDLMGQVPICSNDILCFSLEIENDLRFWKIEIKGSSFFSPLTKLLTEIGHKFYGWEK